MPDIMQQAAESRHPPGVVEFGLGDLAEAAAQPSEALASQMHDAKRMLKAVVHRARIDQIDEPELTDVAQPLHPRMVDDDAFDLINDNRPVDGIADFVGVHARGIRRSVMGLYKPMYNFSGSTRAGVRLRTAPGQ